MMMMMNKEASWIAFIFFVLIAQRKIVKYACPVGFYAHIIECKYC